MLFYTGMVRSAGSVLREARQRIVDNVESPVDGLVAIADRMCDTLQNGSIDEVGELLDASWTLKKRMASNVSNNELDRLYQAARAAGALGGKVSGAGGGGCLLLYVPPGSQPGVRAAMSAAGLKEVAFSFEPEGSRIVHYAE
jgi:D-glycero-alpha-D-manno-heptose-7-phosphate kinase